MTDRRKRAAIVTPYGLFNYGNRLQNRAVTEALEARGYDVETLIMRREYPMPVIKDVAKKIAHTFRIGGRKSAKYRSFHEFDRPIRTRRVWSRGHLSRLGRRYDLVAIGSDQIWNPHQVDFQGAEFGDFAPNAKKVAVSPSFGVVELPESRRAKTADALRSIEALSVREFGGQKIIKGLTGRDAEVLIDPTLGMTADRWREISDTRMVPTQPYMFVYLLGKHEATVWPSIERYAAENELTVVTLMDKSRPEFFAAGPQDFIALIDGAQAVVADSFHAAVFSHLFEVPFFLASRIDGHSMTSRFETFSRLFDLDVTDLKETPGLKAVSPRNTAFSELLAGRRDEFDVFLDNALR